MTIPLREIWRPGQIAADVPQVEMADLIPSSCDCKGVHYPHYCPPPPNILPSSVVVTLDVVLLRVKLQFACKRPGEKGEIRALMMVLGKFEEEIFICCLTAGHSLIADLFRLSYQHVNAIFAKNQLIMEKISNKIKL